MNGRRRAGQMEDLVHLKKDRIHNIMSNDLKVLILEQMSNVLFAASE